MRDMFPGYFMPTEEDFKEIWEQCLFVPDANTLLNLYRYNPSTRDDYIHVLNEVSERLWLPHQVGLEFLRNRLKVIRDNASPYEKAIKSLAETEKGMKTSLDSFSRSVNADDITRKLKEALEPVRTHLQKLAQNHPDYSKDDPILPEVERLFTGKTGKPYTSAQLQRIYKRGEQRYENRIPPGFADAKEKSGPNRFGDYILWRQMLAKAKTEKKPIIFITGDVKEDWWVRENGQIQGPLPELVEEMHTTAGVRFYMYQVKEFFVRAREYQRQQVQEDSATEIERVTEELQSESNQSDWLRSLVKARENWVHTHPNDPYAGQLSPLTGLSERRRDIARIMSTGGDPGLIGNLLSNPLSRELFPSLMTHELRSPLLGLTGPERFWATEGIRAAEEYVRAQNESTSAAIHKLMYGTPTLVNPFTHDIHESALRAFKNLGEIPDHEMDAVEQEDAEIDAEPEDDTA